MAEGWSSEQPGIEQSLGTPVAPLHALAAGIHQTAADHGFWDKERNFGEMIALGHSELSEALEEHRDGNPPVYFKCPECGATRLVPEEELAVHLVEYKGIAKFLMTFFGKRQVKCPGRITKPEGEAVELMDTVIRCFDTMFKSLESVHWTVDDVMALKNEYNKNREFMHGRSY